MGETLTHVRAVSGKKIRVHSAVRDVGGEQKVLNFVCS